uniref:ABC-type glutathione-S-conjugate transporter n=1 Tax=Sphaeramia orbicularis TaxID=375764 RepID=A0A673AZ73_9TELE
RLTLFPDPHLVWFQDWNLTWNTDRPNLSRCFQHTVLVWFPCVYLWTCSPFYLLYLQLRPHPGVIHLSRLCCSKMVLGLSLASFSLVQMLYFLLKEDQDQVVHQNLVFLLGPLIRIFTLVLAVSVIHIERLKGVRSSVVLFFFWTLLVLCSIVPLKVDVEQITEQNRCPEEDASFLSKFFFFWFSSLVVGGYRRPLCSSDLWSLRSQDSSTHIMSEIDRVWTDACTEKRKQESETEMSATEGSGPPDHTEKTPLLKQTRSRQTFTLVLLRTLGWSFGLYFMCGTVCLLLHDVTMFMVPQVLSLLLAFMHDPGAELWKGFLYSSLLFVLSCLQSLLHHHYMCRCFTVGMRLKTAVMGLVYRKCLLMSSSARRQCTLGEIISLVSADVQKLMDFVVYVNSVWVAPIEIAFCFYFLWQLLGPPSLAGLSAVVLIFPLNGFIAKLRSRLQEVQMTFMDGRIKLMNEILSGVKILKFYAWEEAFLRRVGILREGELKALKKSQIYYCISLASFSSSSFLILFAVFGVYVLIDDQNVLDAQKIFVSVALINILKTPLSQLPFAMSTSMQAIISLRRLANFLQQDEVKAESVERLPHSTGVPVVVIESGSFAWSPDGPVSLHSLNIKVEPGSIVAVVGHVGSGKSSLLSAMLGEMERRSGSACIKGSVAYVPQQAWILNASLKENVLFGGQRIESWYHRVMEACALLPDLDILPGGDGTEIGEKGLNLSGGQKQRVSLARAVYRKSDVYLLDDPLSAVDAHVGQHIFDRVIGPKGLLRDKTRVLVTNGISFLSKVDLVLVMEDGQISEMGSFKQLMDKRGAFATFIHTHSGRNYREPATHRDKGSRKSVSRLSLMEFSIDLSQEQLISGHQVTTDQDFDPEDAGKLTEADSAHTGRVKLQMYSEYFRTLGRTFIVIILFLCGFQQTASLAYSYWLSLWADDAPVNGTQTDHNLKLGVFALLGFTQGLSMFGTTLAVSLGGILASRYLHADLLQNVLHSPMSFFEVTPSGNLLNRFSKEIDAIDCMIPDGLKMMLGYLFKLLEVCIIVLLATPFTGLVLLPLTGLYILIQSFYVATSCQLRRLEAVSRSPIYTHFNETVQGAGIIRAFGEQQRFILEADRHIDNNQQAYFPRFVATRWLAVNLEFLGNLLVLAASLFSVYGRGKLSPGIVGLAVTHSLQVTGILSWIVRSWTDVENNIVSVERVKEYARTPKEAPWTVEGTLVPSSWPSSGSIQLEDFGLQYRKGLDWALKDISISIQDREKVGIVGRTGAGKSSLALGIFRILEAVKGRICIDGVNIAQLGLHELRSRLTIIPQDPVLFSGTLRMNLDPFETCSDQELWKALELSHLTSFVSTLPKKLDYQCSEGGENLSVGQRQLLCLARALLRKTRILVLDEATAAVDLQTDQLIQSTIRTQFEDCTVLTIAHRLNTIIDYSRVLVMDQGSIVEAGPPSELLRQQSHFYQMCVEAGLA